MQRTFVIGVRVAVSLALALLVAPRALRAQSGKAAVVIPAGELKWMDNAAVKGARLAVLWGDPKTGGYGAIKKVPAGFKFGAHTHTSDFFELPLPVAVDPSHTHDLARRH